MSQELLLPGTSLHGLSDARPHAIPYVARLLTDEDYASLNACFSLRYNYFVQDRAWVKPENCPDQMEYDGYDARALHLAVFDGDEVQAYLRVLPRQIEAHFMLDDEFSALLSEEDRRAIPREGAVELSRLVCRYKLFRQTNDQLHPMELLLRLLYRVSRERGFQRFYIVVEKAWLKPFARRFGLPFHVVGQPYTFPDGTRTVVATATLSELEVAMQLHSSNKHAWYQNQE